MSQEVLHQHNELAQHTAEIIARFDNESLPDLAQHAHVHLGEHDQLRNHHIEIKEGHACGADCPDHGDQDHEDHGHHHEAERKHAIVRKSAEHACVADCVEHGTTHNHEESHNHHDHVHEGQKTRGHHIETKPHTCAVDCPEHNHNPEDAHVHEDPDNYPAHPESQPRNDHHIEPKLHACGADCPEHGIGSGHDHAEVEQPEPGQDDALAAYQKAEEAIRYSQLAETQKQASKHEVSPNNDSEFVQARTPDRAEVVETALEAERVAQIELQVPAQQSEKQKFVAESSTAVESSILATDQAEAPAELLLELDAVETVKLQPEAETSHEGIDRNAGFVADVQLLEAEVAALAEAPAIPSLEYVAYSDGRELNDEALPTMHSEILDGIDDVGTEAVESSESTGTARVELPIPEPTDIEHLPEAYEGTDEVKLPGVPAMAFAAVLSQSKMEHVPLDSEQAAEGLAELISQRIEATAERSTPGHAPLHAGAIQKALRTLAELHSVGGEKNAEASQQQLLRLLQLLGYENPAQTLKAYIYQYGADFVSELQAKLFELLSQGRVYESVSAISYSSDASPSTDISALGMFALALATLRGYLSPVTRGI